jgi:hypothetical protein
VTKNALKDLRLYPPPVQKDRLVISDPIFRVKPGKKVMNNQGELQKNYRKQTSFEPEK